MEPSGRKLAEDVFDGLSEGALEIAEGEVEGPGVFTDAGANVSRRKYVKSVDMNFVVDTGPERSDKRVKDVL